MNNCDSRSSKDTGQKFPEHSVHSVLFLPPGLRGWYMCVFCDCVCVCVCLCTCSLCVNVCVNCARVCSRYVCIYIQCASERQMMQALCGVSKQQP